MRVRGEREGVRGRGGEGGGGGGGGRREEEGGWDGGAVKRGAGKRGIEREREG